MIDGICFAIDEYAKDIKQISNWLMTNGIKLQIHKRRANSGLKDWYVSVICTETLQHYSICLEQNKLAQLVGNGDNPFEAISDVLKLIQGKKIKISTRKDYKWIDKIVDVPNNIGE